MKMIEMVWCSVRAVIRYGYNYYY